MRRLFSRIDPLAWFGLVAAAIFAVNAFVAGPERETVEVTPEMAAVILENRAALVGADLEPDMAAFVLNRFAEDEILVREAVARGLHLGDVKIRARLIEKMEFLLAAEAPEPSAEDLADLQAGNPMRYKSMRRWSFEHRFFGPDRAAAEAAMADWQVTGVMAPGPARFWLGEDMQAYSAPQLQTVLGHDFAKALAGLPLGTWTGPLQSGRGWHLVRLTAVTDPAPLPAAELAQLLREDWRAMVRQEARDDALAEMRGRYDVRLPGAQDSAPGAARAAGVQ